MFYRGHKPSCTTSIASFTRCESTGTVCSSTRIEKSWQSAQADRYNKYCVDGISQFDPHIARQFVKGVALYDKTIKVWKMKERVLHTRIVNLDAYT